MEEEALIGPHLHGLQRLASGQQKPRTTLQIHFVAVCDGRANPVTPHEKAFLKWRRLGSPDLSPMRKRAPKFSKKQQDVLVAGMTQDDWKAYKESASSRNKPRPRKRTKTKDVTGPNLAEIERRAQAAIRNANKSATRYFEEPVGTRDDFRRDTRRNWSRSRQPK